MIPFPHCIDSTIIATFRSCRQKAFRQYMEHWKPKGDSVHLVAGKAFADGIEKARKAFYEQGKPQSEAVAIGLGALIASYGTFECPPDSAKSLERTCGALEYYFSQYPLGADGALPLDIGGGRKSIEFSFAEPIRVLHPVSGDPLLYTGRADMVATFAGAVYAFDEKTTSSLGNSWAKQWDMRSQFTGYTWAGRRAGFATQGVIVRGVSILKTKFDTMQVVATRSEWEIERWERALNATVEQMIASWRLHNHLADAGEDQLALEAFDYNLDHACSEYGGCPFLIICKSPRPADWLPNYFERRVWDPLSRKEMTPEEYEAKWERKVGGITAA